MSTKKDIGSVLKSAMDGYSDSPDPIWPAIESSLKKQRQARILLVLLLLLGLITTGTMIVIYGNSTSNTPIEKNSPEPANTNTSTLKPTDTLLNKTNDKIIAIDSLKTPDNSLNAPNENQVTTIKNIVKNKSKIDESDNATNSDFFQLRRSFYHTLSMLDVIRQDPLELTLDSIQLLSLEDTITSQEEEIIWRFSPFISLDHYNAFGRNTSRQNTLNYGAYLYFYGSQNLALRVGFKKVDLQYNFQDGNTSSQQQVSYNEIPMEGRYFFNSNRELKTSFIVGGSFLFLQRASLTDFDNNIVRENRREFTDAAFSLNAGLGLHYDVSSKWRLNLESSIRYHVTPYTSSRNFSPYNLSLSFGVEYGF